MAWSSNDAEMSAKHIADYVKALEEKIKFLSDKVDKLSRENYLLKGAIAVVKDIDLSKINSVDVW